MKPTVLVVAALVVIATACSRVGGAPAPDSTRSEAPAPQRPTLPADESRDAIETMAAMFPLGLRVHEVQVAWDHCAAAETTFERLMACALQGQNDSFLVAERLPEATAARFGCGHEIENVHRVYVLAVRRFFDDLVTWLRSKRTEIGSAPLPRPLARVCPGNTILCDSYVVMGTLRRSTVLEYQSAQSRLECVSRFLQCDAGTCGARQ